MICTLCSFQAYVLSQVSYYFNYCQETINYKYYKFSVGYLKTQMQGHSELMIKTGDTDFYPTEDRICSQRH